MKTPHERKEALAQFIRSHGHRASVYEGTLTAYIHGESYTWRNCPTFQRVRVALGLPTEYITLTGAPADSWFDESDPIERAYRSTSG